MSEEIFKYLCSDEMVDKLLKFIGKAKEMRNSY